MFPRVERAAKALLVTKTLNKYELADLVACHQKTAQRILKKLNEERYVHVFKWEKCYRAWIPSYRFGDAKDKAKPKPKTNAETQRKRRKDIEVRWKEALVKRKKRFIEKHQSKQSLLKRDIHVRV